MNLELKGKIAIVTGSTQGIGLGIAESLLKEGAKVVINGRDQDRVKKAWELLDSSDSEVLGVKADVTDLSQCKLLLDKVLSHWGRLDILVCNVGSGNSAAPGEERSQDWEKSILTNLTSATNMVETCKEALFQVKGNILCISSICGRAAIGGPATYAAAKSALNAYVQSIARAFGKKGVRVNAIAPGNILFKGGRHEKRQKDYPQAVSDMLENEVSLGRMGSPKEIGDMAAFLTSPLSGFTTGSIVTVDGGQIRS